MTDHGTSRRTGVATPEPFLTIELDSVVVTSCQVAPEPTDAYPLDSSRRRRSRVRRRDDQLPPAEPDRGPRTLVKAGFDFLTNKAT
ncbi:MAG: hypothetical protein WB797_03060 [Nocardioides sp.]